MAFRKLSLKPRSPRLCYVCGERSVPEARLKDRHYKCYSCENKFQRDRKASDRKYRDTDAYREHHKFKELSRKRALRIRENAL